MLTTATHTVSEVDTGDGVPLALHRWDPPDGTDHRAALYYVHGIQSHAGWLFETGPALAAHGVVTHALDRRGSGRSGGVRGDLPSADLLLADYLGGLRVARREVPDLPVTVLGQSFGASIVAGLVATGVLTDIEVQRLVYCTPALGQQGARHGTAGLARLRTLTGTALTPLNLEDEDYTDHSRYLEFMANDHLMLRQVTERSRATMVALEQHYTDSAATGATGATVHFVRTSHDPIIDLDAAEQALRALHGTFERTEFPVRHHYIEFSTERREYWAWLADVAGGVPR